MLCNLGLLFGLLVVPTVVIGAPGPKPIPKESLVIAQPFVQQLTEFVALISPQYVREIDPGELYLAALSELYAAVREPFPTTLAQDLKDVGKGGQFHQVLADARAKLGVRSELAENRDVIIAMRGIASALDPYCGLVPEVEFQSRGDAELSFGFDLEGLRPSRNPLRRQIPDTPANPNPMMQIPLRVATVRPGSPAQEAGLRPGDVITHIGTEAVTISNASQLYHQVLNGPIDPEKPKEHVLTVQRLGKERPLEVKLSKRLYSTETVFGVNRVRGNEWNHWFDRNRKIAYIRVGSIETTTPAQVNAAVHSVRDAKGLILDLRWCPGGYLTQSTMIASTFLGSGLIASIKYRQPERQGANEYRADDVGVTKYRAPDFPLVVLVNGETMGGGELIAAALQDHKRAVVVGQRTVGKASIQTPIYPGGLPGWNFKLTAGTFERPSGKNLQRFANSKPTDDWGIRPNDGYTISISPSLAQQIREWYTLHALRPSWDREAMSLDDPEADPQRKIAAKMLQKLIDEAEKK